ncbi:hypothetical protein CHS0354_031387 [Potamilus streckersoni]|uniref:Sodefrin-like factor n=1 Tax=Potamilus streckersoni TaxID=2493646 RepID=A0AAE0VX39_9BIVA|nr:hypothetical protein CHS0354_031387 [Potamilus streckersoni]
MLVDIFWIMLPGRKSLVSFLMVFLMVLMEGDTLRCVRCMSITNARCEYGDIPPVNCSLNEKYCIQYVGDTKLGKVFFRDCSTEDMKNECVYKLLANENVLACYSTCQTDGCNHAQHVLASELCVVFLSILRWLIR